MTYSVVARDPRTGELGVAVQSHWFGVGATVPWVQPDAGAVVTQSIPEIAYGPEGLAAMADGGGAVEVLRDLIAGDKAAPFRQVGIVDRSGLARAYSGASCIPHAGHEVGDGFACQANMMLRDTVPAAMAAAFAAASDLPLTERLLAALDAAEAEGGDLRGRQSAALLIAPPKGRPWERSFDVRVDDHSEPLVELRRLVALRHAYALANRGDELSAEGRLAEAAEAYAEASETAPGKAELRFFAGVGAAQAGDLDLAVERLREAIAANPRLEAILERVPEEMAPGARLLLDRLRAG